MDALYDFIYGLFKSILTFINKYVDMSGLLKTFLFKIPYTELLLIGIGIYKSKTSTGVNAPQNE